MNWKQLISNKRFGLEEIHATRKDDRSEFQRDFDRLIFSAPFRRLQNKTQVFPLPGSIFVHNRLTHSLEVSCVGRSLGDSIANRLLAKHPELADTHISDNLFLRRLENVAGDVSFYYGPADDLRINYSLSGDFICPCAFTLEDVRVLDGQRNYYRMIEGETIDRIVAHVGAKYKVDIVKLIKEDMRS